MVDRYGQDWEFEPSRIIKCPGPYVLYKDYEALEAKLDALLIGLQVKEITDLKTKSPEHFKKLAECIADDSQEKSAKIMHLEAKLAAECRKSEHWKNAYNSELVFSKILEKDILQLKAKLAAVKVKS